MLDVLVHAAIGAALLAAGAGKVTRREELSRIVAAYEIVGRRASRAVAAGLPWLEIAVGAALVLGLVAPLAATAAAVLFAGFAGALAVNRLRGRTELACGCFRDEEPRPLTWGTVARPAALGIVAALPGTAVSPDLLAPLGSLGLPGAAATLGATAAGVALAALVLATGAARRALAPPPGAAPVSDGYLSAARLIKESP